MCSHCVLVSGVIMTPNFVVIPIVSRFLRESCLEIMISSQQIF